MSKNLRNKLIILLAGAVLLLGSVGTALGQFSGSRRVRVYNPARYHRTRTVMNRRAALRKKVLKKKRQRAARHRRHSH